MSCPHLIRFRYTNCAHCIFPIDFIKRKNDSFKLYDSTPVNNTLLLYIMPKGKGLKVKNERDGENPLLKVRSIIIMYGESELKLDLFNALHVVQSLLCFA